MNFRKAVKITDDYTKLSPLREDIKLGSGRISKVDFHFPAGCAGLVGVRVLQGASQLWPLTSGEWIVSDDHTVTFSSDYLLDVRPYNLTIVGYSEDDTYPHTIYISITVDSVVDSSQPIVEAISLGVPTLANLVVSGNRELNQDTLDAMKRIEDNVVEILLEQVAEAKRTNERLYSDMSLEELVRI